MVNHQRLNRISKFLSRHLRHAPSDIGLTLEQGGWIAIDALLVAFERAGLPITHDDLTEVVRTSDKQRFAIDESGTKIRANQGHSVEVDLQLVPSDPPTALYHGTTDSNLAPILRDGLRRMNRHHVHLSSDTDTAYRVGRRHGKPVILVIDTAKMRANGYLFFRSENGVWLVDAVPPEYLRVL